MLPSDAPAESKGCGMVRDPVAAQSASASVTDYVFHRPQSIERVLGELFAKAEARRRLGKLVVVCPPRCVATGSAVELKSAPRVTLSVYLDVADCAARLRRTESKPIVLPERHFASMGEISSWLASTSRGRGADGRQVYRECPGLCSPRYRLVVRSEGERLAVRSEVICGHARDKSDGMYLVEASVQTTCGHR